MKKILFLTALTLLAGCAGTTTNGTPSAQARMRTCMISEANTRFQAGTLFTDSLSVTSEDIVNTCLKKLALQAAGISEESQNTAQNIITNLKALSGK